MSVAFALPDPTQLAKAVDSVEYLDQLRQGLASSLLESTAPVSGKTFRQVCYPVAIQAQALAQENGWQVKQIAQKYRNPEHAPNNFHAKIALVCFQKDDDRGNGDCSYPQPGSAPGIPLRGSGGPEA
ncbi:MAG: c-type heme family protein [Cyanobacteriota bacterium]